MTSPLETPSSSVSPAPPGELGNARRGKAAGAFRTISEVATDLDVPQHVLRFWETKFSQVRPLKRGGGRRPLAIDVAAAESRYERALASPDTPETLYDQIGRAHV